MCRPSHVKPRAEHASSGSSVEAAVLIAVWIVASAICSVSSKTVLSELSGLPSSCALTLSTGQFVVSTFLSGSAVYIRSSMLPSAAAMPWVLATSGFYTAGFLLLNASLTTIDAALAESIRGLEPIWSIALTMWLLPEDAKVTKRQAAALLVMLIGVTFSLASVFSLEFAGIFTCMCANLMFALRSIATQCMRRFLPDPGVAVPDPFALFFVQHVFACAISIPMASLVDGLTCVHRLDSPLSSSAMSFGFSVLGFYTYNQLALIVLYRIGVVPHSIGNCARRVVTILACTALLGMYMDALSGVGYALTVLSSIAYTAVTVKISAPPCLPCFTSTTTTTTTTTDTGTTMPRADSKAALL